MSAIVGERYDQYIKQENHALWLALKYHKTHKNEYIDFIKHPYLKAIYCDKNPYLVVMKSVQSGISEFLVILAISYSVKGLRIFYIMPSWEVMRVFKNERFDKSLYFTKYYQTIKNVMKEQGAEQKESIKLENIGDGTIAFVGSNSEVSFLSFAADIVIIDEFTQCNKDNIKKAYDRLGHSEYRYKVIISNPKYEDMGIDTEYKESDQKKWNIKHGCGNWINPEWYTHVVRETDNGNFVLLDKEWSAGSRKDINLICDKCNKPFYRYENGLWVPTIEHEHSGYHINKLFSGTETIKEMVDNFKKALVDPAEMQVFQNSTLGLSHTDSGSKIDDTILNNAINGEWQYRKKVEGIYALAGIDIGNIANIIIGYILGNGKLQVTDIREVDATVKDINYLLDEYNVFLAVADARPERFLIRSLKQTRKNIFSCYFTESEKEPVDNLQNVKISRTDSMDEIKEDLILKNILLPMNARAIPKFYDQMKAPVRVFNKDKYKGQGGYDWIEGSKADHYYLSMVYLKTAKKILASA
ncbi:MAG: terminase gpA endonuclease subunit [Ignavibacteria bacterium]